MATHEIQWAKDNLQLEGVGIFADFNQMVRTPYLQAVIIASPTALHVEHTMVAIAHGVHVLCEKPVTTELPVLRGLVEAVENNPNTKVMVGFVRRFDEEYRSALQKIQEGTIGDPIIVRSQGAEKLDKSGFFIEYARQSGSIFVDTVVHDIDLTLSFLGEDIKPKALWATGLIAHHHELAEFQDVDNAVGIVEFWGGKIAHYYHSRTTAHGYDNCTEIVGTEGKVSINLVPHSNRVQVSNFMGIVQDATPCWFDRYREAFVAELEQFTDSILEGKELPLRLTSACTGLEIALGLQESLRTGCKIEFDTNGKRKL
ncbi:NAD-binding Rossmann fold oxidoreductase [Aspergillus sclerotialis]|uniref:NAD-binding Rossmann fold oxidoreductase n=1 Tax=Aspergillus sclerotialis TaxID=2070753 RepID=A0A3A2ZQ83_9EURO|nr:NAD-binding Rossmann fold oxidoreductase [Aspergillus sclerotialis]